MLVLTPAYANGDDHHGSLFPHIPEPEGKKCVEPEDEMRRNHMNYILHQRDETMYRGIRTPKYSLAECIDCHADKPQKYIERKRTADATIRQQLNQALASTAGDDSGDTGSNQ